MARSVIRNKRIHCVLYTFDLLTLTEVPIWHFGTAKVLLMDEKSRVVIEALHFRSREKLNTH